MSFSSVFSFCAEMKKLHSYVPRGKRNLCISKEYSLNNPLQLVVMWKAKKKKKDLDLVAVHLIMHQILRGT